MVRDFFKPETLSEIENAVTEIEKTTSAEVVVALAKRSGDYRDVHYLWGIIMSQTALVFMLFSHFDFHMYTVVPMVLIVFAAAYNLSLHLPAFMGLLVPPRRREAQVRQASLVAFYEEGVTATKDRSGILFYFSLFERQVEILPDMGIDGRIPRGRWNMLRHEMNAMLKRNAPPGEVLSRFKEAAKILSDHLPLAEGDIDEIPNRPRIRA